MGARGERRSVAGNFVEQGRLHPTCAQASRDRPAAAVRGRLGMDRQRLFSLSAVPSIGRAGKRIQRQIHVRAVRPARRLMRDARSATCGRAIAIFFRRTPVGSFPVCAWPETPMTHDHRRVATRQDDAFQAAVDRGAFRPPGKSLPSRWLYDERGSELFEQITRLDEYYPTRAETRNSSGSRGRDRAISAAGACC